MTRRSVEVFRTLLGSPDSSPRAVIESMINDEATVTCPDCETDFPKETGYCPECEEKKDLRQVDEGSGSLGELSGRKIEDFRNRLDSEIQTYNGQPSYATFRLNALRQRRINGRPTAIFEIRASGTLDSDNGGSPPSEKYYVLLGYDREANTVTTTIRRGDSRSGSQVNDQTTFFSTGVYDFNEQYMRGLIDRIIDDINVDFYENVA